MRWIYLFLFMAACAPYPKVQAAFLTHDWQLATLNGAAFPAHTTLTIRPSGHVLGTTPCNRFATHLMHFPPGWEFGKITLGKNACVQGNAEAAFMRAITQVTRSRVEGVRLILSGPGLRMEFVRAIGPPSHPRDPVHATP